MMHKLEIAFVWTVGACLGAVMFTISFWLFVDTRPPIQDSRVELLNESGEPTQTVKRGEQFLVARDMCVERTTAQYITRSLISTTKPLAYLIPASGSMLRTGCKRIVFSAAIPRSVPPGRYDYIVSYHYSNNPLSNGIDELLPVQITVVE